MEIIVQEMMRMCLAGKTRRYCMRIVALERSTAVLYRGIVTQNACILLTVCFDFVFCYEEGA